MTFLSRGNDGYRRGEDVVSRVKWYRFEGKQKADFGYVLRTKYGCKDLIGLTCVQLSIINRNFILDTWCGRQGQLQMQVFRHEFPFDSQHPPEYKMENPFFARNYLHLS